MIYLIHFELIFDFMNTDGSFDIIGIHVNYVESFFFVLYHIISMSLIIQVNYYRNPLVLVLKILTGRIT
jgi:hypothetical protein